jgi:hypothetical protein
MAHVSKGKKKWMGTKKRLEKTERKEDGKKEKWGGKKA